MWVSLSLRLTGIGLFLCSVDSPLAAEVIAYLFSSHIHEEVGHPQPRPRYLASLSWYQEPTKFSYILGITKIAPLYTSLTCVYIPTCWDRKGKRERRRAPRCWKAVVPLYPQKSCSDWIRPLHISGCQDEFKQLFSVLLWQENKSPGGRKPYRPWKCELIVKMVGLDWCQMLLLMLS